MAAHDALDQNAQKNARLFGGSWSTRSSSIAHDIFTTVDLINELRRSRFKRTLGQSWSDMWPRKDTPMKIRWRKSRRSGIRVVGSWPTNFSNRSRPKLHQPVRRRRIFAINLYKLMFSLSFKLNFLLKREEIKHFWSKISSSSYPLAFQT